MQDLTSNDAAAAEEVHQDVQIAQCHTGISEQPMSPKECKKMRRRISNRESAIRIRERRQEELDSARSRVRADFCQSSGLCANEHDLQAVYQLAHTCCVYPAIISFACL